MNFLWTLCLRMRFRLEFVYWTMGTSEPSRKMGKWTRKRDKQRDCNRQWGSGSRYCFEKWTWLLWKQRTGVKLTVASIDNLTTNRRQLQYTPIVQNNKTSTSIGMDECGRRQWLYCCLCCCYYYCCYGCTYTPGVKWGEKWKENAFIRILCNFICFHSRFTEILTISLNWITTANKHWRSHDSTPHKVNKQTNPTKNQLSRLIFHLNNWHYDSERELAVEWLCITTTPHAHACTTQNDYQRSKTDYRCFV